MSENNNEYELDAAGLPADEVLEAEVEAVDFEEPAPAPDMHTDEGLTLTLNKSASQHAVLPEPEPEPVAVAPVEEPPAPAPVPAPEPPKPQPVAQPVRHVVTNNDADPVYLSACVYENKYARKSLTVHHVQRRLADLGYNDAVGDKDGWYGELTALAVKAFQKSKGLDSTGLMDEATFTKLFDGDSNVEVVLN